MTFLPDQPDSSVVSRRTLDAAIGAGVITREQADALMAMEARGSLPARAFAPDDEQFRFIRGFGDIFVTIGLALFLVAVAYFAHSVGEVVGAFVGLAAASWGLAEYFTRIRRMALPSIVLLLVFAYSVYGAAGTLLGQIAGDTESFRMWLLNTASPPVMIGAGAVTAIAAALHYWRFRVPITVAAGAGALVAIVVGLAIAAGLPRDVAILAMGFAVFALAMRYDLSDPQRVTRRTDIAFWLHMLAAPLVVHPLIGSFSNGSRLFSLEGPGVATAAWILGVFAALALVALIVDRRAMLVSGLSYAGIAFSALVGKAGLSGQVPLTLLVLGALVLILSAGWHSLRRPLLRLLPERLSQGLAHNTIQT